MEIVFSADNRKETLHLPIIPEIFEVSFPHKIETIETIAAGEISVIGKPQLKSISFDCWAPSKPYSFAKTSVLAPEMKEFFVKWKRKGKPLRIVITSDKGWEIHNELYAIANFAFGLDVVGDMPYKLELTQFVPKQVKK